jgi:hypothetical protein
MVLTGARMRLNDLSAEKLRQVAKLQKKIESIKKKLSRCFGEMTSKTSTRHRKLSASARRKIAAAQKARWAKFKASLN